MSVRPVTGISVADLGTNTVKITHAAIAGNGDILELEDASSTIRLGTDLELTGRIESARIEACIVFLQESERRGLELGSRSFIGVATEAFRIADNGHTLLERIHNETGWNVRLIPGEEEARLTYIGLKGLLPEGERTVIADIGGGSTEIVHIHQDQVITSASIQLGSGRLADRFFKADPPGTEALVATVDAAASLLSLVDELPDGADNLLFAGGNGVFLAELLRQIFPREPISVSAIEKLLHHLGRTPAQGTADRLSIVHERARVLPAGVAIALALLRRTPAVFADGVPSGIRRGLLREYASSFRDEM